MTGKPHRLGFWWRLAYLWFGYGILVVFLAAGAVFPSALYTATGRPDFVSTVPIACGLIVTAPLIYIGIVALPDEAKYRAGIDGSPGDDG